MEEQQRDFFVNRSRFRFLESSDNDAGEVHRLTNFVFSCYSCDRFENCAFSLEKTFPTESTRVLLCGSNSSVFAGTTFPMEDVSNCENLVAVPVTVFEWKWKFHLLHPLAPEQWYLRDRFRWCLKQVGKGKALSERRLHFFLEISTWSHPTDACGTP